MDYRNNPNLEDNNTIIYGHNMKSDEMYGTLQNYKNQEYYDNHKILYYFTQEKKYEIKLIAGYTASLEDDIYNLMPYIRIYIFTMKLITYLFFKNSKFDTEISLISSLR